MIAIKLRTDLHPSDAVAAALDEVPPGLCPVRLWMGYAALHEIAKRELVDRGVSGSVASLYGLPVERMRSISPAFLECERDVGSAIIALPDRVALQ